MPSKNTVFNVSDCPGEVLDQKKDVSGTMGKIVTKVCEFVGHTGSMPMSTLDHHVAVG